MEKLLNFARVLADETRQEIMLLLCCHELSVTELVMKLAANGRELTQPTVSHHLTELRNAELVTVRKEGRQTFYTLNQQEVYVCCGKIMTCFAPNVSLDSES